MGAPRSFHWMGATAVAFFLTSPARAQTAAREVTVHLKATPDVTLEREEGDDWVEVCFAPCDLPFSSRARYRVGGGIRDSEPFRLRETQPGLEVIVVEPRSRGAHALGDVFIGIGSAMTTVGLLAAGIGGAISSSCSGGTTRDSCGGGALVAPGLAFAVVGIGVLVLGVDWVVTNHASRVHAEPSADEAYGDLDRLRTMRLDLARRQEASWAQPSLPGEASIFVYHF